MNFKLEIIDNFFTNENLQELNSLNLEDVKDNSLKIFHNKIKNNNVIMESCIDNNLLLKIYKTYNSKVISILKSLNLSKSEIIDYTDITIIKTGKNYKFPIHDDTPDKLLSGVIYLSPAENTGTIFYKNKKGENKKTIEWKKNRAVFFSRIERETWHSYEGNGLENRTALIYNLMTNNIKKVYEIEKKNYLLGLLRWKLNPYLYHYFKINY